MSEKKIKFVDGKMYEYEIMDLVDPYSEVLKTLTPPFDFSNPPTDPKKLGVSLVETMVKHNGVGLAAPQVGLSYRVFVMGAEGVGFACFNPEILEEYHGYDRFDEGCLSFKGLFLPINRPERVKVRYQDWNGLVKEETFSGLTARIFQHERDHLDGIVFTTKVSKTVLERAKGKVKSNCKKLDKQIAIQKAASNIAKRTGVNVNSPKVSTPNSVITIKDRVAPPLKPTLDAKITVSTPDLTVTPS